MSLATVTLLILCVIAFAAGLLSKTKSKFTGVLVLLPLAAILTVLLVSSPDHITFQEAFLNLLAFNAHAARASFGLYAVLVLFCFGVGTVVRKVKRDAT